MRAANGGTLPHGAIENVAATCVELGHGADVNPRKLGYRLEHERLGLPVFFDELPVSHARLGDNVSNGLSSLTASFQTASKTKASTTKVSKMSSSKMKTSKSKLSKTKPIKAKSTKTKPVKTKNDAYLDVQDHYTTMAAKMYAEESEITEQLKTSTKWYIRKYYQAYQSGTQY
jgi:hypothetical protein